VIAIGCDGGIVRFEILYTSKVVQNTREIQFAGRVSLIRR
jgi:hypothetical protein